MASIPTPATSSPTNPSASAPIPTSTPASSTSPSSSLQTSPSPFPFSPHQLAALVPTQLEPPTPFIRSLASMAKMSEDFTQQQLNQVLQFLQRVGISDSVPDHCNAKDFYSVIVHDVLKPLHILPGRVICLVSVKPAVANIRGGFHGGAVAAVAEAVSIACARTVIADDKELILGGLGISYLSVAPKNEEVIVDGSVVRSGRKLTVIAVEFKLKKTGKLAYAARATFYHTAVAKL